MESGEWSKVRQLRNGLKPSPRKLKNSQGETVDSTERTDTLAEYHEKVQWRVRPDDLDDMIRMPRHDPKPDPKCRVDVAPTPPSLAASALSRSRGCVGGCAQLQARHGRVSGV